MLEGQDAGRPEGWEAGMLGGQKAGRPEGWNAGRFELFLSLQAFQLASLEHIEQITEFYFYIAK